MGWVIGDARHVTSEQTDLAEHETSSQRARRARPSSLRVRSHPYCLITRRIASSN
jgi:hypothetical protein